MKKTYFSFSRRFFLVSAIIISLLFNSVCVLAKSSQGESQSIITALALAEDLKSEYGLDYVDFEQVTCSTPIIAYDYCNHSITENAKYIPIKYKEELIGWVINYDGGFYQFSTEFVSDVNKLIEKETKFSFIYTNNACYYYDGNILYQLSTFDENIPGRGYIESIEDVRNLSISFSGISDNNYIGYVSSNASVLSASYYSCGVSYVTQNPYQHLCWAASAACIANYLYGCGFTALNVAYRYNHNYNDTAILVGNEPNVLAAATVGGYIFHSYVPSDSVMQRNIRTNYPILATFSNSYSCHDTVICGIDVLAGYIRIMDPLSGFINISYSLSYGYRYYVTASGQYFTLSAATCYTWTP